MSILGALIEVKRRHGGSLDFLILIAATLMAGAAPTNALGNDVLTQHNDNARTGTQLNELVLKPSNVSGATFGRLYERQVDGQIIAQPLYVSNLSIPNVGVRNVVYVATRKNVIYAFDADNLDPDPNHGLLWSHPVTLQPAGRPNPMCSETLGPVGITSTPVIDRASGTMYVVARKSDGTIWLHALDIATGADKAGTPGVRQISASFGGMSFNQGLQLSRAGLLLWNGAIFIGFSALNCDNPGNPDWHGWVLAYRASDLDPVGVFATTSRNSEGGGIWASGKGIAADGAGGIYFQTGNGGVRGTSDLGQSFVKLSVGRPPAYGLSVAGVYTVSNWAALNAGDTDLGSSGPVLLPSNRLAGGGKQGKLYVLNTQTMLPSQNEPLPGPVVPPGGSDGFQAFINSWHDDPSQSTCMDVQILATKCFMPHPRYEESERAVPNIHTGPIFWNNRLFWMPEKDFLRAFPYNSSSEVLGTAPVAVSTVRAPDGMPGGAMSISANGNIDGVIWANIPKSDGQWGNVTGSLVAFDAMTLREIWRDDDDIGFAKFNPTTIAGGRVFRPTFADKLIVYGLKQGPTPQPCYNIAQLYQNYTGPEGTLGAATGPESAVQDGVGRNRTYQNGVIYWTPTLCAHEVQGAILGSWIFFGSAQGFLGYPLTNESVTPDGIGRFNHFQNGSIYWTFNVSSHEVRGAIRDRWASLGWETRRAR